MLFVIKGIIICSIFNEKSIAKVLHENGRNILMKAF